MHHPTKHDNVNEESVARFVFGRDMIFSADHFMGLMTTKVVVSSMHSKRGNKTFPSLGEIEGPPFKWQTIFFDSYSLRDYNWMLDKQVLQEPDYRSVNGNSTYERVLVLDPLLHEKFRRKLMASNQQLHKPDANKMLFSPERFSVALHLRRGDVLPTNRGRFTKDEYYLGIVKMIREVVPDADVQAFSSLEGFQNIENFKMYTENDITVHFEEHADVCVAWLNMIHADMLIMAKSAFSVVPALLNFQCVVYEPSDYLGKLEHWVTESTFNTSYIRNCYAASGKRKLLNARQSMSI